MQKTKASTLIKFLVFSIFGVLFFFINVNIGGVKKVPLIHLIDNLKELIGLPAVGVMVTNSLYKGKTKTSFPPQSVDKVATL